MGPKQTDRTRSDTTTLTPPRAAVVGAAEAPAWWMLRARPRGIDSLLARATRSVTNLVQLSSGRLEARLFRLVGPEADASGGHANLPIRSVGTTAPEKTTVTFVLACPGGGTMNGHAVAAGDALVWPAGSSYDGIAPSGYRWATVILPGATLYDVRPRPAGIDGAPAALARARLPAAARGRVRTLLREMQAWGAPGKVPVAGGTGEAWRDRWIALAEAAVRAATPCSRPSVAVAHAMALVRATETCLLARLSSVVYTEDLCRQVGAGERTIEAAFRRVLGIPPMRYLEILRAHAVFLDLRRTDGGAPRSVGEAEARAGVAHTARFAQRYRSVFGENPAETLRAARGATQPVATPATAPGPTACR